MDTNTVERIKQIIEESGFNQKEFCEYCDIGQSTLSSVLKGKGGVTLPLVLSINKAFPRYSLDWITKGEDSAANMAATKPAEAASSGLVETAEIATPKPPILKPQSPQMALAFANTAEPTPSPSPASSLWAIEGSSADLLGLDTPKKVKNTERPSRQVVEIRVFFDDGTYQVLTPQG